MAPTESSILANYLTVTAKLPTILSFDQFTALFPRSQQSNPQIRSLYRDLQHQRNAVVDAVTENIAVEEKRGRAMRREAARIKREAAQEQPDVEMEIERAVCDFPPFCPSRDLSQPALKLDNPPSNLTLPAAAIRSHQRQRPQTHPRDSHPRARQRRHGPRG